MVEEAIQRRKSSAIYQFVRGNPEYYIECGLRQELEETLAREERVRRELERLPKQLERLAERKWAIERKIQGD